MDNEQLLRYSRHILLPEIGIEGQDRLRAAGVLIVGMGGLGCPAALYLCTSGVGQLTIADADRVDLTNLQRQILYRSDSVGATKVQAAQQALVAVNPHVEVIPLALRMEGELLDRQVAAADVVLDCSDNFATRHAINRACVKHARPLVSGAAMRFDGQVSVFDLRQRDAACYACLFAEDGRAEEVKCAEMGVLAPLTGIIGALQAAEALKLLSGAGEPLGGRLLLCDAARGEFRTVRVRKDPDCAVCGRVAA
ncbi:MAG: molybdopterin-synthase adenylyltransferase MoeB [Betaproteobacteria bacterium]|nr:molybdopterin-synthase adenylyltransferase MoeB [Betaproteobacteria bacterium]